MLDEIVTRTLVELADTLVEDFDVVDMLTMLTDRCVESFDVQDAGLLLASPVGSQLRLIASSSRQMQALELYELQSSEGPCIDAYDAGEAVLNQDLTNAEERWPKFAPAAMATGFGSVSAIPLRYRDVVGALNLFRSNRGPLADADVSVAKAYADIATIAILQHQAAVDAQTVNEQLNHALNNRVVIEQAKGMLAERAGVEVHESFELLRSYARERNVRLAKVAQDFLDDRIPLAVLVPDLPPVS